MKDSPELKTIATYQLGNTSVEIRARGPLTDEAVERFNEKSQYIRLIKKERGEKAENDTQEVGEHNGKDE